MFAACFSFQYEYIVAISVIDLGCGTGQFWEMCRTELGHAIDEYTGIDFSVEAIRKARYTARQWTRPEARRYIPHPDFICATLHGMIYAAYDTDVYIASEVLEHLKDDLGLLEKLNSGTPIIITVPDFPWESHVRHFSSEDEVRKRYEKHIDIEKITYEKPHYLLKGILK